MRRIGQHRFVARGAGGGLLGCTAVASSSVRQVYAGVVEESVYVAEAARGLGVGRGPLERLLAETEAAGIWTVQAGIQAETSRASRSTTG